jgi:hypothetical protein
MLTSASSEDRLEAVVRGGRNRLLLQTALRELLLSVAVGVGGLAALLALGTDYFPPVLLWLCMAAGIIAGILRWRKSRPAPYRVAQLLDRRWHTDDQVSTAYYFLKETSRGGAIAGQQRSVASELAAAGDLVAALPFRVPQMAWAALAMLALCAVLFVARYSLQPTLSLDRPLSSMLLTALLGPESFQDDAGAPDAQAERPRPSEEDLAPPLNDGETRTPEARPAPLEVRSSEPAAQQPADPLDFEMPEVEGLSVDDPYGDEMDYDSLVEGEQQVEQEGEENPSEAGRPSDENSQASEDANADPWNQEPDSLLERLKDAFQNMMAKMNMTPPMSQEGEQAPDPQSPESESEGENAEGSDSQSEGGASQTADAQMEGGEASQDAPQQVAQGDAGDSQDQSGEGPPTASAGNNEGSKAFEEEAQLAEAMGRLEELYSRRAEEIKGEVMIETDTARQSARTPYQPTAAGHEDRGGTVSRDAIPLAYQPYIKSYFENLRTKN